MTFTLSPPPYAYDALEPHMSAETLEFHHGKHHRAYVDNLNKLLPDTGLGDVPLEKIVQESHGKFPALHNNAGQHYNHVHFWNWMKKNGGGRSIPARVQEGIDRDLGGYSKFRDDFIAAGVSRFGSGWCWLSVRDGRFAITSTPNGESPLLHGAAPLLGCDVWEHAYYIDYRNGRAAYLAAFLDHLVNWEYVEEMIRRSDMASDL